MIPLAPTDILPLETDADGVVRRSSQQSLIPDQPCGTIEVT